ncbi:MAG: PadR family transcriptional regulator [Bacteroidetes bacterium]|nr:PadR family transcriptional regulator [Bacteroidota bacterium]MCL5025137.1 PadR family transcriptional regulator [Chloroflexota bacterium]
MWHRGPFGRGPRHGNIFERGDFKYIILDLLKEKPRHGYEIIRAVGERFGGFYTPSPGVVYPTLQMLEDMGYITSEQQEGKKVYTITDEGRKHLAEQQSTMEGMWERVKAHWGFISNASFHETMHEFADFGRTLARAGHDASPEKLRRVREVIARARHDVEAILDEGR